MAAYQEITNVSEWENVLESSMERPQLIFKHSTTCPISAEAFRELEAFLQAHSHEQVQTILVKVIESRPVSNQIMADTGVKHESPQAILIHKKSPIWHASHWKITKESISEAVSKDL